MSAGGADDEGVLHLSAAFLVIVAAQHQLGSGAAEQLLGPAPPRQPHPPGDRAAQHVVLDYHDAQRSRRRGGKVPGDPLGFGSGEMSLHRDIVQVPGERAQRHAMTGESAREHRAGQLERGSELRPEVVPPFAVAARLAEQAQRTPPPLGVVIAGDHQGRCDAPEHIRLARKVTGTTPWLR